MARDRLYAGPSRNALVAAFAAGLALAPFSSGNRGEGFTMMNGAAAQSAGRGADLGADIGGVSADVGADIGSGGASVGADLGAGGADGDGRAAGENSSGSGDEGGGAGEAGDAGDAGASTGSGDADTSDGSDSAGAGGSADDAAGGAAGSVTSEEAAAPGNGQSVGAEGMAGDQASADGDHPGVRVMDRRYSHFSSLDLQTPAFRRYRAAAERNSVAEAGDALSAATTRPVTKELVVHVNEALDVRTVLSPSQIVAAANGVPAFDGTGAIPLAAQKLTTDR